MFLQPGRNSPHNGAAPQILSSQLAVQAVQAPSQPFPLRPKALMTPPTPLLGIMAPDQGEWEGAESCLQEALSLFGVSHLTDRSMTLHNLGKVASRRGALDKARHLYEEALSYRTAAGDLQRQAETLSNLGALSYKREEYSEARRLYEENLSRHRQPQDRYGIGVILSNPQEGDLGAAVLLFTHYECLFRDLMSADLPYPFEALRRLQTLWVPFRTHL